MLAVNQTVSATGYRLSRKGVAVVAAVVGLGVGMLAGGSAVYWKATQAKSTYDANAKAAQVRVATLTAKLDAAQARASDFQSANETLRQQASASAQQAVALAQTIDDAAKQAELMPQLRSPTYAEPWTKLVAHLSKSRATAQSLLSAASSSTNEKGQP